ncbi:hypothetical protein BJF81_07030 [Ornithinimicrobium sp. CNJ-824]|nr:hypothetical protein BJF81_07030 [Ornithinimicrobium sp. CNJ-824]
MCGGCDLELPGGPAAGQLLRACTEGPVIPGEWVGGKSVLSAARRTTLPRTWLGPGALTDPAALARLEGADGLLLPVGPVATGSRRSSDARTRVHGSGVGGVDHDDAPALTVEVAGARLTWAATAGHRVCLAVRGAAPEELAAPLQQLLRHPDGGVVGAVEVDLRGRDEQTVLRATARVREAAGRTLPVLVKVLAVDPQLVAVARSAVAGGASAVVVSGQVPLGGGRWWTGPSNAATTRAGLRSLCSAAAEQRWPGTFLVAAGGIHSATTVRAALSDGADGVQVGTALWADPTLLPVLRTAAEAAPPPSSPRPTTDRRTA